VSIGAALPLEVAIPASRCQTHNAPAYHNSVQLGNAPQMVLRVYGPKCTKFEEIWAINNTWQDSLRFHTCWFACKWGQPKSDCSRKSI